MTAIVKWNTPAPYTGKIDLFRTSDAVGNVKPENALVSLPNGTLEYSDDTVDVNQPNFYTVGVNTERGYTLSNSAPLSKFSDRGPGPASLIWGNEKFGYFGTCKMGVDFPSNVDFGNGTTLITTFNVVHKFIRNNRIIYIPQRGWLAGRTTANYHINNSTGNTLNAANSAKISTINSRNYVSSRMEWNFDNSYPTTVNTTEWEGYKFNVRAPRSMPDDWNGRYNDNLSVEDTELNIVLNIVYGANGGYAYMPELAVSPATSPIGAPFITAERNVLAAISGVYSSSRIAMFTSGNITLVDPAIQALSSEGESGVLMAATCFQFHPIIDLIEF